MTLDRVRSWLSKDPKRVVIDSMIIDRIVETAGLVQRIQRASANGSLTIVETHLLRDQLSPTPMRPAELSCFASTTRCRWSPYPPAGSFSMCRALTVLNSVTRALTSKVLRPRDVAGCRMPSWLRLPRVRPTLSLPKTVTFAKKWRRRNFSARCGASQISVVSWRSRHDHLQGISDPRGPKRK